MQVSRDLMARFDLLFSGFPNQALCLFTKIIIEEYCSLERTLARFEGSDKRWSDTGGGRRQNCAVYRTAADSPNFYAIAGVHPCIDQSGLVNRSSCS